ncbi:histidine phosphatase family protein [Haloarchaeobius sp. HME9146]|uniref:histidine phosphatase family protein n=1 Tax=Haloarchaeobius sp. HME9146 TaxID=2978732 RepID=UPI0021BFD438|nr:histidine phosphatase family protein [Haloarchaeobius sp. HME9146]MCT9095051.1 histidine phosphatase family protein [Haloarchaeobius sp. HME9146]
MSADDATVVLARHGETEWNRERRIQGWAPAPLNDAGREQARVLGDHLADSYDVDRLVASDLRRTKETARLVNHALGVPVEFDPSWRERNFGVYQGLGYEELFEGYPEFAVQETGVAAFETEPEGGETLLESRERVLAGWRSVVGSLTPGETVAVVTHGGPLYVLLGYLQDRDLVEALTEHSQGNCAVTEVRVDGGEQTVLREGDTAYR